MNNLFILFVFFISFSDNQSSKMEMLIQKEIREVFKIKTFEKQGVRLTTEQTNKLPLNLSENNFFKIYNENRLEGYYYVGKAFGKTDYFDFIVIFDNKLIISKVKVLVYREERGGEVASKRWLNQFTGKSSDESLIYQKGIAAISGATISAKSITNQINKLFQSITILHTNKLL